eukprot:2700493-Amphidinium_carterae.2
MTASCNRARKRGECNEWSAPKPRLISAPKCTRWGEARSPFVEEVLRHTAHHTRSRTPQLRKEPDINCFPPFPLNTN